MNPTIGNIMLRVKCAVYNAFTDGESGMSCVSKHTEQAITEAQAAVEQALGPGEPVVLVQAYRTSAAYDIGYEHGKNSHVGCGRCSDITKPCDLGGCVAEPQPQREWVGLTDDQRTALIDARNEAMQWALKGRIPESGAFAGIAQNLDFLCDQIAGKPKD